MEACALALRLSPRLGSLAIDGALPPPAAPKAAQVIILVRFTLTFSPPTLRILLDDNNLGLIL